MNKKVLCVLVVILLSVSFVFANAEQENPVGEEANSNAPEKVLKFSINVAKDDPYGMGVQNFADLVYTKTNGRLKIDVYYGGVLGGSVDSVKSVMMGSGVDMTIIGGDALMNFYSPMQALAMPYTYDDIDHLNRVLESPTAKKLMEDFEAETGVKIIGWHNRGPRELSTANTPVYNLEDLKGLKMRVPPVKASVSLWQMLGASPTTMDFTEVYTSLSQGVIDGQENPLSTIYGNKLQEVQKYIILTDHVMVGDALMINAKLFDKLSQDFQEAIMNAAAESQLYKKALADKLGNELVQKLKEAGCTVIEPDKAEFKEATKDLYIEIGKDLGDDFVAAYESVREEAAKLK